MPPSSPWCQCKQTAGIKCLHCSNHFCRLHFREHEANISHDIHPLLDRLNHVTEQKVGNNAYQQFLVDELQQWQKISHQRIDHYCQTKHREIEDKLKGYENYLSVKIQQVKEQLQPLLSNDSNMITNEQMKTLEDQLNELEKLMNQNKPSLQFNPLHIDPTSVAFMDETSVSSLLDLKTPRRTCQMKFDASPIATDGKLILLQDRMHSLGLYEYNTFSLHHRIPWSTKDSSDIVDLHWSCYLHRFLILTCDHLYTLNSDGMYDDVLTKTTNDFRTITTDDDHHHLFIATSLSIKQYSLSSFTFSKRIHVNEYNIYSLRFNTNLNQFGLTVRTCHEHKWHFEVRDRSLTRLWSLPTPIECGACLASVVFSYDEWIIINTRSDVLFHVTKDGEMKGEVIYGGRNLLNAIENKNLLVIRTYGYLEQYRI